MAPFTPFMAEEIYKLISKSVNQFDEFKESVHLETWTEVDESLVDEQVITDMVQVRKIVEMGLSLRAEAGIKVKQPLSELQVLGYGLREEYFGIIKDELNIKEIGNKEINGNNMIVKEDGNIKVSLNTEITAELKLEGLAREVVRAINQLRKEMELTIQDRVEVEYETADELLQNILVLFANEIKKSVLADSLKVKSGGKEIEVDGKKIMIRLIKM